MYYIDTDITIVIFERTYFLKNINFIVLFNGSCGFVYIVDWDRCRHGNTAHQSSGFY